jgi:undecaprenyl diphosphate synthase
VSTRAESPTHVAIIMDGNGRWARMRGLPRPAGHRASVKVVRKVVAMSGI